MCITILHYRVTLLTLLRSSAVAPSPGPRRGPRSRSNTATSMRNIEEEAPTVDFRGIPMRPRLPSGQSSPRREHPGFGFAAEKPALNRNATFEGPRSLRDNSPAGMPRLTRVPTDSSMLSRSNLRPVGRRESDVFGDPDEDGDYYDKRSVSPAPSFGSTPSRTTSASYNQESALSNGMKKMPPPPPPSRSKKPPPPPPLKRSALSTSEVPYAH